MTPTLSTALTTRLVCNVFPITCQPVFRELISDIAVHIVRLLVLIFEQYFSVLLSPVSGLVTILTPSNKMVYAHTYLIYGRKEYSTLSKLFVSLKESELFMGSYFSFLKAIHHLGFE